MTPHLDFGDGLLIGCCFTMVMVGLWRGAWAHAEAERKKLRELVKHCWIHSGYHDCGYVQMTTEQKALYRAIADEPSA